jgi:hypothetical protein
MGARSSILLAKFIRREIELSEIPSSYQKESPQNQEIHAGKSLFYAGVRAYQDGDIGETRRLWSQVNERTESELSLDFEYFLLHHEKKKLAEHG